MTTESDVKSWLEVALAEENLQKFSVKISGSTEKGSGFLGDVIFVIVTGVDQRGSTKEYNLVLKCSKPSVALETSYTIFKEAFLREIQFYQEVVPIFKEFQENKKLKNPFESVPKCYGVYDKNSRYILVLENLKKSGYDLYNNKKPLTRKHIDLVLNEYAKYHATSVALKEQEPENFKKLANYFSTNILVSFFEQTSFESVLINNVQQAYELLKDDMGKEISEKWLVFKNQIHSICYDLNPNVNTLKVLTHGDCWNNNFMFKYKDNDQSLVSTVKIIDWQIASLASPVKDLSYFLFATISGEDVKDLNIILKAYYTAFCQHLIELDSTFEQTYSFEKFFEEWKNFAKYGLIMCIILIKFSFTDTEDIPDMAASAEKGEDIAQPFNFPVRDFDGYKNRLLPIIKYAAHTGII